MLYYLNKTILPEVRTDRSKTKQWFFNSNI